MSIQKLFVCFILLCLALNISAKNKAEEKKEPTQEQKTSVIPKQSVGKRGKIKTLEEFIPSEEVSPDKPIAFPNDI